MICPKSRKTTTKGTHNQSAYCSLFGMHHFLLITKAIRVLEHSICQWYPVYHAHISLRYRTYCNIGMWTNSLQIYRIPSQVYSHRSACLNIDHRYDPAVPPLNNTETHATGPRHFQHINDRHIQRLHCSRSYQLLPNIGIPVHKNMDAYHGINLSCDLNS